MSEEDGERRGWMSGWAEEMRDGERGGGGGVRESDCLLESYGPQRLSQPAVAASAWKAID